MLSASPAALAFTAGDRTQAVTASFPADSGCAPPTLTWAMVPDAGFLGLGTSGASLSLSPPIVFCRSSAQTFTLIGTDAADASVVVPVTLAPWGRPNTPVFVSSLVSQRAGTDAGYAPSLAPAHACEATAGFPGTDLDWTFDGGVPGVSLAPSVNRLFVYSTNACVGGTVTAYATRKVSNVSPDQSSIGSGVLQIQLLPDWSPITAFDAGFSYDPALSRLVGGFSTGANCEADRDLRARVRVMTRDGGPLNAKGGFAVPGPWAVDVPGGCGGGSFLATATLIDDAGMAYGPPASFEFQAERIEARVPELNLTSVPVTCENGARGLLQLDLLPTDCAVEQFSWTQNQGPAVTLFSDAGVGVSFATAPKDLQAQAGQQLGWSITATVGVGNSQVASRSIRLVPEAFVQIAHRTDVPVAREEEAVGIEVILTNRTDCAVSGLVLRETLGGLVPVPGSLRVAGATVEATIVGDVLDVPGLSLPANQSTHITYLARVRLLSAARPSGQVWLKGTDVTLPDVRVVATTGCGCDSTGSALGLWALAAALVRSRRRSG